MEATNISSNHDFSRRRERQRRRLVGISSPSIVCRLLLIAVITRTNGLSKRSEFDFLVSAVSANYDRYPTHYRLKNHPRSSSSSSSSHHYHHQKQQTTPLDTGILLAQNPPPLPDDYSMNEEEEAEESTSTPLSHQQDDYARNLYRRYLQQWEEKNRDREQHLQPHTTSSTDSDDEFFYQQLEDADDYYYDTDVEEDMTYNAEEIEDADANMLYFNRKSYNDDEDYTVCSTTAQPIVYRYFGRHQVNNSIRRDYIPFIVLGPAVGHWRAVGEILSSKGYSVMACEVQEPADGGTSSEETEAVVKAVLKAMRWRQAVVVGCDYGNVVALKAALKLSSLSHSTTPSQVAGLILTGDLTPVSHYVNTLINNNQTTHHHPKKEISIDTFLKSYVPCPSTIVWDGDLYTLPNLGGSKKKNTLSDFKFGELHRVTILGGGIAPHRRSPEHFSWVLARFVEENLEEVATTAATTTPLQTRGGYARRRGIVASFSSNNEWIRALLSEDGLVVTGRLCAIPFLCLIGAKVLQFHYNRSLSVLSTCHAFAQSQRHAIMFIGQIISNDWKRKNSFLRNLFTQVASFGGVRWRKNKKINYGSAAKIHQENELHSRINWNLVGVLDYEQVAA